MRIRKPSAGVVLGGLALFVALSGTAYAVTNTVSIADPTTPSRVAHVDPTGHLVVGDGSGPLTVNGLVQLANPSDFFHQGSFGVDRTAGCVPLAVPPTGKAAVVRTLTLDVYQDPSPGPGQDVALYADNTCSRLVGDVNPATVGNTVVPFDPGVATRTGMSVAVFGDVGVEVYASGYYVPVGTVPAELAPDGPRVPSQS